MGVPQSRNPCPGQAFSPSFRPGPPGPGHPAHPARPPAAGGGRTYDAGMAIPIPDDVRALLDAPNYVHLLTLRADGSPRNWVVWTGLEGDYILVCTGDSTWKAKDMRRDPRVALSVNDIANP